MTSRISYTRPSITDLEVEYATDAARNGWGPRCYDYIIRFEESFRRHVGAEYSIATSSCTGALHLGLAGLGVGPGDEVIMADINWIATAAPVVHLGAEPVLVDILRDSWCIDPARAEAAITPRTKAIIATHLYGNVCEMAALLEISRRRGIPIVEDAAEAIGSKYGSQYAGTMGVFGTFSFHGSKTVTTGEGGMFVTNDASLHERVLTLSNHGRAREESRQFWPSVVGYKYKLSNIEAAIGCAQVERIHELVARKRRIFELYESELRDLDLSMNPEPAGRTNGYWMPTIILEGEDTSRDDLMARLRDLKIDSRVFFWPLSSLDMFEARPENAVSYRMYWRGLNLPSYHSISEDELLRVTGAVRSYFEEAGRADSRL